MKQYSKFLRSLEDMSNYQMIEACNNAGLQKIASGSSRVVFAINDKLVIKIALGNAGKSQNENELRVHYMLDYDFPGWKKYFAKIHVNHCHPRNVFIVMERLETKTKEVKQYSKDIVTVWKGSKTTNRRAELQFKAVLYMDSLLQGFMHQDLHPNNFGKSTSGLIKLLDYGLFKNTYYTHYGYADRRKVKKNLIPAWSGTV